MSNSRNARQRRSACRAHADHGDRLRAAHHAVDQRRDAVSAHAPTIAIEFDLVGEFRSPWDDIEAGHHYARSLAAWGLLIAASGVQYDGIARTLSFDPIADGRYPFTTGTAWGVATIVGDDVTLDVRGGRLDLASLSIRGRPVPSPEARLEEAYAQPWRGNERRYHDDPGYAGPERRVAAH